MQNEEAFQFTDDLLGDGVTYETSGSLQGGKKVWMLARLPRKNLIAGDQVAPYLVIFNSHDGSSGVKVAMTPIRVVCQNTLLSLIHISSSPVDIPDRWNPRTSKHPTGVFAAPPAAWPCCSSP